MASKGGFWGLRYGRRRGITVSVKSNGVHRAVAIKKVSHSARTAMLPRVRSAPTAAPIGSTFDTRQHDNFAR